MRAASRIVIAVVLLSSALFAADDSPIAFDVVSIKPVQAGRSAPPLIVAESLCTDGGGRFGCPGVTVRGLVRIAFQNPDHPLLLSQIVGGPDWIATSQFSITATFATTTTLSNVRQQLPTLLRSLLEDRFTLKAHSERRPFPVYALVIARKDGALGPSIHPSTTDCPTLPPDAPTPPRAMPASSRCFFGIFRSGTITSGVLTMDGLARNLTTIAAADRIVVDRTGLTEKFDVNLHWAPDIAQQSDDPPLVTALQEQLGLKLEPRTELLDAVVIDSVERPSAN
jgi:uncharacterized protein (TIGR03435 family)